MKKFARSLKLLAGLTALLVGIHIFATYNQGWVSTFGIEPRDLSSLPAILSSPFIHASWLHLASNLVGLLVFSALILFRSERYYFRISLFIIILTGLLVWCFARPGNHIGASGWIFGLWSFTISRAFFEKSVASILLATVVIFFYGGMVFGLLPSRPHISFEAHIFGALSGVVCAYLRIGNRGI